MTASAALEAGRAAAEALMAGEEGELRGPDVDGPIDEDTGQYTQIPGALKYAGVGKGQSTDTIGAKEDAAERIVVVARSELHLPISAPLAAIDDIWTWTASILDPLLEGRRFRIAGFGENKSYSTVRRYAVEEVQS